MDRLEERIPALLEEIHIALFNKQKHFAMKYVCCDKFEDEKIADEKQRLY